jgi:SAM-dependent methyltransferase
MTDDLDFTGERFVPGTPGEIWYEHWHRYHFAAHLVAGRTVLDIACGEGYGSALLSRSAAHVTGADVAASTLERAWRKYAELSNLAFRSADCSALPFADASFDVVVSFETIEHIAAQETFVAEVRRVLRPGGVLVLSCPNRLEYSDKRRYSNPHHVRELYREELATLLAPHFTHTAWFGQRPGFFSLVWPEEGPAQGEIFEVSESSAASPSPGHTRPLYFIVIASDSVDAVAVTAPRLSVLADRDEWVYRDYEKVMRELEFVVARGNELESEAAARKVSHDEIVRQRDALLTEASARRAELTETHAALTLAKEAGAAATAANSAIAAECAARTAALDAKTAELEARTAALGAAERELAGLGRQLGVQQAEIARRASIRWWIALPLRRVRLALKGRPPWE